MSELDRLLSLTSRTFALSIPRLPDVLRHQVGIGYLVFRIADTVEDEGDAEPAERAAALRELKQSLNEQNIGATAGMLDDWNTNHRPEDDGYAELLSRSRWVAEQLESLNPQAAGHIRRYVGRTIDGMIERLLAPAPIADIADVKAYCYHVAGIVGEMLTELFISHHAPLAARRDELMRQSACFGEALQLVNILRDHGIDLDAGRRYVPDQATYAELLELAEQNCAESHRYLELLGDAQSPPGVVEFNAFNLGLAEATLGLLRTRGPGAKVSRDVVSATLKAVQATDETDLED